MKIANKGLSGRMDSPHVAALSAIEILDYTSGKNKKDRCGTYRFDLSLGDIFVQQGCLPRLLQGSSVSLRQFLAVDPWYHLTDLFQGPVIGVGVRAPCMAA